MAAETNDSRADREHLRQLIREEAEKIVEENARRLEQGHIPPGEDQTQALLFATFEAIGLPMKSAEDRRRSINRMTRLIRMQESAYSFAKGVGFLVGGIIVTAVGGALVSFLSKWK